MKDYEMNLASGCCLMTMTVCHLLIGNDGMAIFSFIAGVFSLGMWRIDRPKDHPKK